MFAILFADDEMFEKGEKEPSSEYHLLVCCAIEASVVFMYVLGTERFSVECRRTKSKVITLTNHRTRRQFDKPTRTRSNTCSRRRARENACEQVTIGSGLTSDWLIKWREIC